MIVGGGWDDDEPATWLTRDSGCHSATSSSISFGAFEFSMALETWSPVSIRTHLFFEFDKRPATTVAGRTALHPCAQDKDE
jgi:hypothetical protein